MRKVVFALAAVFVFAPFCRAQNSAWADKLFGPELTHDFGVVARGAQLKYTFKMTNIYKVPLEITDVRVQCGCVKAEPSTKMLQPNESASFTIHMDGRQFTGQKTVRIFVTVGPKFISTATLTVSANARGDVTFSPNEIDFGTVQRGQTPTKSIDVEYTGALADWRVIEIVKSSSAPFELKVDDLPRSGGAAKRGYRITATMRAEATIGTFKQEVTLKTNDIAGLALTFNIVGNVQAGVSVTPSPVVVRDLKAGEVHTKKVIVRGSRSFRILGIDGQGDGVSAELPTREDTTHVVTLTVAPAKAGDLRRTLMIRTDFDNERLPLIVEASVEP
jgi:hypothetical protein